MIPTARRELKIPRRGVCLCFVAQLLTRSRRLLKFPNRFLRD
ncbi:GSCOCG00000699001-RA-CDS [Cotesia congregata]|nr:GSCOCG00000699001-RA-CDS [Cotesia congregata]